MLQLSWYLLSLDLNTAKARKPQSTVTTRIFSSTTRKNAVPIKTTMRIAEAAQIGDSRSRTSVAGQSILITRDGHLGKRDKHQGMSKEKLRMVVHQTVLCVSLRIFCLVPYGIVFRTRPIIEPVSMSVQWFIGSTIMNRLNCRFKNFGP